MFNVIKLAVLVGIVFAVIYVAHGISSGQFNPQQIIEQKTQEVSDMMQQMVNNAYQELTQDVDEDVNDAYNETQKMVTDMIKE